MGIRYILIIIAIWVLFLLLRNVRRRRRLNASRPAGQRQPVDMVRCRHCGTHLPAPEALRKGADYFCSREHLLAERGNRTDSEE